MMVKIYMKFSFEISLIRIIERKLIKSANPRRWSFPPERRLLRESAFSETGHGWIIHSDGRLRKVVCLSSGLQVQLPRKLTLRVSSNASAFYRNIKNHTRKPGNNQWENYSYQHLRVSLQDINVRKPF